MYGKQTRVEEQYGTTPGGNGGKTPGKRTLTEDLGPRTDYLEELYSEEPVGNVGPDWLADVENAPMEPDGKSAQSDLRTRSLVAAKEIGKERDEAKVLLGVVISGREELQKEIDDEERKLADAEAITDEADREQLPGHATVKDLKAKMAEIQKLEGDLTKKITEADADLKTITQPGATDAKRAEILARRDMAKDHMETEAEVLKDEKLLWNKLRTDSTVTKETTSTINGASVVDTTTETKKLRPWEASTSTTHTQVGTKGDEQTTTTKKHETKVGVGGYDGTSEESESTTKGDKTTSTSKKTATHVDTGKASRETTVTEKDGDQQKTNSTKVEATRGDGKAAVAVTKSKSEGTVDADGNLIDGKKTTGGGNVSITADAEKVGAGGGGNFRRETAHSANVRTGVSSHCDGGVTVTVKPYGGEDETLKGRFVLTVKINWKIGSKVDAGFGKQGGAAGASVSAGGSVGGGGFWSFVMSAEETEQYLKDLGGVSPHNAANGKRPEFAKIAAAWRAGWSAEEDSPMDVSADAVRDMKEGEERGFEETKDGNLGGGVDAKSGIGTFGAKGGFIKKGALLFSVAKLKGKTVITIQVDEEEGWTAGGSAGVGAVSGEYGHESTKGRGSGAVFYLDPSEPAIHDAEYGDISAARTIEALEDLKRKYAARLKEKSTTESETEKDTYGVKVFGDNGVEMGETGKVTKKVIVDENGKETEIHDGRTTGNAKLKVGPLEYNEGHTEGVTTRVNSDGEATGDLFESNSETDYTKSLLDWDDRQKQLGPEGKATGADKFKALDSENQQGLLLADADYNRIIATASSHEEWMKACERDADEWEEVRVKIKACKGDKKKVAAVLAEYMGDGANGKEDMLANVVRRPHTNQGGLGYEFPDGMAHLKEKYAKLVFNDPTKKAAELKAAGDAKGASEEAQKQIDALDSLYNELASANQDKFLNTAAFGEMTSKIGERKKQLAAYTGKSELALAQDRYNDLLTNCQKWQQQEEKLYTEIHANQTEFGKSQVRVVELQNQLRDLYLVWDPAYKEMCELAWQWGFDKTVAKRYKPDKQTWKQVDSGEVATGHTIGGMIERQEQEGMRWDTEEDNERVATNLMASSTASYYKSQNAAPKMTPEEEKKSMAQTQRGQIAAERNNAAKSAHWHNSAKKNGKPLSAELDRIAADGWNQFAKTEARSKAWEKLAATPSSSYDAILAEANAIEEEYRKVYRIFDKGAEILGIPY